ncbi:MAG: DUF3021 domain-containing protein, partial [Lachnospiraceae bacterium]|nr:DUF3021 domain-containing protein [Lachnospiraceae bacterium]
YMYSKIKEMLYTFSYVTTGVLFSTALFITIFAKDVTLSVSLLWQILITSCVCVLGNLIYLKREITAKQTIIRILIHYIYINIVVFSCAVLFDWYDVRDIKKSGFMFLCIIVVFAVTSSIVWQNAKRMSEALNNRLKEYQDKKAKYAKEQEEQEL